MFNANSFKILPALVVCACMLVACSKEDEQASASSAIAASDSILQYIPADSPYVFVSLEPFSDEIMDSLEPKIDRVLTSYQGLFNEIVASKKADMSEEERNSEDTQRLEAIVAEISTLLSMDGLRGAGLETMRPKLAPEPALRVRHVAAQAPRGLALPVRNVAARHRPLPSPPPRGGRGHAAKGW